MREQEFETGCLRNYCDLLPPFLIRRYILQIAGSKIKEAEKLLEFKKH